MSRVRGSASARSLLKAHISGVRTFSWTNLRLTARDVYSTCRPKQKQFIEPWTPWLISKRSSANWTRASML